MRIYAIIISLFLCNIASSQIHILDYKDPEPLDDLFPSLEAQVIDNVKQIVRLNVAGDTSSLSKYNIEGDLIEYYSYSNGLRNNTLSSYRYSKHKDTVEIKSYKGEKLTFYSKSYYDVNKNCVKIDYLTFPNVIQTTFRNFDSNNNCIQEYSERPIKDTLYFFEGKRPIKVVLPNRKAFFKYNKDLLLIERTDSLYNTLSYYLKYEYNEDIIVKKEFKNETRFYEYENDKLSFVKFLYKDKTYINTNFEYNEFGKLHTVLLNGNTFNLPNYFIFSESSSYYYIKNGSKLKMEFIYDEFYNLIEKKFYVDNVYKNSIKFIVDYHK